MDHKILDLAKEWFNFGEKDLKAATKLGNEFNSITCFHCQQTAEKYIKGLLLYLQVDFRKSHDLNYLLELLDDEVPDEVMTAAEFLNEYAVETRYPGNYPSITDVETSQALEYAKLIKDYILTLAKEKGYTT